MNELCGLKIGYALTGSYCTFEKSFEQAEKLVQLGAELVPIVSENVFSTSTRFGTAEENIKRLEKICGKAVISTIAEAEPIGPKNLTDLMLVSPCTSNTANKLALSLTDTAVTMAVKSHLRGGKPVLLAIASNDSLMGSAKTLGMLFNTKNYYFVPVRQDNIADKPSSLVADFTLIPKAAEAAMKGIQLRPIICT